MLAPGFAVSSEVILQKLSSNQLAEYYEEVIALYNDWKVKYPEDTDLRAAT